VGEWQRLSHQTLSRDRESTLKQTQQPTQLPRIVCASSARGCGMQELVATVHPIRVRALLDTLATGAVGGSETATTLDGNAPSVQADSATAEGVQSSTATAMSCRSSATVAETRGCLSMHELEPAALDNGCAPSDVANHNTVAMSTIAAASMGSAERMQPIAFAEQLDAQWREWEQATRTSMVAKQLDLARASVGVTPGHAATHSLKTPVSSDSLSASHARNRPDSRSSHMSSRMSVLSGRGTPSSMGSRLNPVKRRRSSSGF